MISLPQLAGFEVTPPGRIWVPAYSKEITLTINLTPDDGGEWRVSSFVDRFRRNAGPGAWFRQLPSDREISELVGGTTRRFYEVVETSDFTVLLETLSEHITIQYNMEWFEGVYSEFLNGEFNVSGLDQAQPEYLGEPNLWINDHTEILFVGGAYQLNAGSLSFRYWYRYEHPHWVLWWFEIGH